MGTPAAGFDLANGVHDHFVSWVWSQPKSDTNSHSPAALLIELIYEQPCVRLVAKKSGELRMCVDYRALNQVTVKDQGIL